MTTPSAGGGFRIGRGVLKIEADDTGLRQDVRASVAAAGAGMSIEIPIKIDTKRSLRNLDNYFRTTKTKFSKAGDDSGKSFGDGVGSALSKFDFSSLDFMPSLPISQILSLTAVAIPAAAAVLTLGSSLGLASASALALIPAAIGVAAGIGAVYLALTDKTTPAGKEFATVLSSMSDEFDKLAATAGTAILPGFTAFLKDAKTLMPDINTYLRDMGKWIGAGAARLGDYIASPLFRGQLKSIMGENAKATESFANALVPITGIFTDIAEAAAPLVSRFAAALELGAQIVFDWLEMKRKSGELAKFFKLAGDEIAKWWKILSNFTVGIIALFAAANPAGRDFSDTLADISTKFKEWAQSDHTRDQIRSFLEWIASDDTQQKVKNLAASIVAVGAAMKTLNITSGVVSLFGGFGPVGLVIGAVTLAVIGLVAAFGYLYANSSTVRDGVNDVVKSFKENLGPTLERMHDFIMDKVVPVVKDTLINAFKAFTSFLTDTLFPALKEAYENYLPKIEQAWDKIIKAFKDNEPQLKTLSEWIKSAAEWIVSNLLPALESFAGFIVGVLAGAISIIIYTIGFFVDTIHAIGAAFTWVKDTAISVWNTVTAFLGGVFEWIGSAVGTVKDAIIGAFQWVWDKITEIWNGISAAIGFAFDIIKQLFQIAWDWLDALTMGKLSAVRDTIINAITFAKDKLMAILEEIKIIWGIVWDWVTTKLGDIWEGIKSKTSDAIDAVKNVISGALDAIGGFFSSMWDKVKDGWSTGWNWLKDKAGSLVDSIKNIVGGIKDKFVDTVHGIPRAIVGGLNAVLDTINKIINKINEFLPDKIKIPTIQGRVEVPQGFATGGRIQGAGTGTSDSIPIMASDGEYMLRSKAVQALSKAYGHNFLDWLNRYDVSGDSSSMQLRPRYADGGLISRTQDAIRGADPLPYVWGAVGPSAYDCSGLVGQVWAMLTGHPSFRRYFTTHNAVSVGGFKAGHGTYTIGLSDSHVVGNLAGLAFEAASSRSGIKVGASAKSVDAMPRQYYLPETGGQFIAGGSGKGGLSLKSLITNAINSIVNSIRDKLPAPGGFATKLISGVFDKTVDKMKSLSFDDGGILPPGPSLSLNTTGRNEQVLSPEQIDRLAASSNGGTTYNFAPGSITLDASRIKDIDDLIRLIKDIPTTARQYGARTVVGAR
jgi:phage-related protein